MFLSKKGNSILTTPIIIACGIIMVTLLVLLIVEILMPYLWYEKLSSSCIKYIYVMEEYGYLTSKEVKVLKDDLESQGFNLQNLDIKYTNQKTGYGEPIFLRLVYDYEIEIPFTESKVITMKIERNSVSKR